MAFINPNTISSITREEFEELKNKVNEISNQLGNITNISIPNNDLNQTVEETIINSKEEFTDEKKYKIKDIEINNAKLNGIPRIEYFDFSNKKQVREEVPFEIVNNEENNENIIDLSDILNNKSYAYKVDNIPSVAKTSSGHRATVMDENKVNHMKEEYYVDVKKIAA